MKMTQDCKLREQGGNGKKWEGGVYLWEKMMNAYMLISDNRWRL